jgi:hypothetical protein
MATITRFYENVSLDAGGDEINNVLGGNKYTLSGAIQQVVITRVSGAATQATVEIRYLSGESSRHKLVYQFTAAGLPNFVDSNIGGQFSLKEHADPVVTDGDLTLFVQPDAACVLDIRLDFDVHLQYT